MAETQNKQEKFISENTVEIFGQLESLEITQHKNDGTPLETKDGIPFKTARARIRVAEGETHQVEFMARKYFKSNPDEISNQWKAFDTYEAEYVSIKDSEDKTSERFGQEPTEVHAIAQLELNVFKNKAGQVQESTRLRGRFMNRLREGADGKKPEYIAKYTVEAVVTAEPTLEVKGEKETGRLLVHVGLIDYQNKMQPFTFVAENVVDENGEVINDNVSYLEQELETGQTIVLNGVIINRYIVKHVERAGAGFGKATVDVKTDRVNEILIEGGLEPKHPDEFDEETDALLVVFPAQFKEAQDNWKAHLTEVESTQNKTTKPAAKKKAGKAFGKPTTKSNIKESDLPF